MNPAQDNNGQNDSQPSPNHIAARIAELHDAADRCYQAGDSIKAKNLLKEIITLAPDDMAAHANLGLILHAEGEPTQAIAAYQKAIDLEPCHFHIHFLLGRACRELGYLEDAVVAFNKALQLKPDAVDVLFELGSVYFQQNMTDEAAACFHAILARNPRHGAAHYNLGILAYNLGQFDEAAARYTEALEENPVDADTLFNLALTRQRQHRLAEAAACYEQALAVSPDDPDINFNLGSIYKDLHKPDLAVACLENAVAANPEHGAAHTNLGTLYHMLGRTAEAIRCYQRAVELDHHTAAANHLLASLSGATTEKAPQQYVNDVFDSYADRFDHSLVRELEYRVPGMLRQLLDDHLPDPDHIFASGLDLGCGTGLAGEAFQDRAGRLTGVDLSPKMLGRAADKKIYHTLHQGDLVDFLDRDGALYDLFIAADVFTYLGELTPLFAGLTRRAHPDAWLLFSTERHDGNGYILHQSGRYGHAADYIHTLSLRHGLKVVQHTRTQLRKDKGEWVPGDLYLLKFSPGLHRNKRI
jgi:predicted TPR repeat methyltransferase